MAALISSKLNGFVRTARLQQLLQQYVLFNFLMKKVQLFEK